MLKYNRNAAIRNLLRASPSTCPELAAMLDIPLRSARAGMWGLINQGHARKTGRSVPSGVGQPYAIYELTPQGAAAAKGDSPKVDEAVSG